MNLAHLINFIKHSILRTFLGTGEEKKKTKTPTSSGKNLCFFFLNNTLCCGGDDWSSGNRLLSKCSISRLVMQRTNNQNKRSGGEAPLIKDL